MLQPGSTAAASSSGNTAPPNEPIYGMNRSSPAMIPHRIGLGTPMKNSPPAITQPNAVLTAARLR